ncbi:MAG: hypothetical protein OXC31_13710 [Spirochaetaceae bacterium]|nr:hypothetical protein [Spirochaetaceae bacterium]
MSDSTDDWKKRMEAGSKKAVEDANATTDPALAAINKQADDARAIVQNLKVSDQPTYNKLVEIVDDATRRNEAIGAVVGRVKILGQVGVELAEKIGGMTTAGVAISALKNMLDDK